MTRTRTISGGLETVVGPPEAPRGAAQSARRAVRDSDSPFVERVTRVVYESSIDELSTPDGCWDIVIVNGPASTVVFQTGFTTGPVQVRPRAGETFICISFRPGVFMPRLPGMRMVDSFLVHPTASARSFSMLGEALEIPTFDNVEGLVIRLARRGLLARDELVESVVQGHPRAASERSVQRHFMQALGITPTQFEQIRRARQAVDRLEKGLPIAAVATELSYSDQSHMTRALRAIMGRTPGQIARQGRD
jgi:AraC-like DNA-binding protein